MTICFDVLTNGTREKIEDVEYVEVIWKAFHGKPTRFFSVVTKDGKTRNLKYKDNQIYYISE